MRNYELALGGKNHSLRKLSDREREAQQKLGHYCNDGDCTNWPTHYATHYMPRFYGDVFVSNVLCPEHASNFAKYTNTKEEEAS